MGLYILKQNTRIRDLDHTKGEGSKFQKKKKWKAATQGTLVENFVLGLRPDALAREEAGWSAVRGLGAR